VTQAPPEGLDPRIVKSLSHPLRHRILVRLNAGEASPMEMAREFDQPVGRVSHHVQALLGVDAIELVRTEPRRGAVEHFYRALIGTWFSDADWARVPASARDAISAQNLQRVAADLGDASDRAFAHPKACLVRHLMDLDEQAMAEMSDLMDATFERAAAIGTAAAARGGGRRTELVLLHFERAGED
jgi:DNA-binding transcriptional ArsR family regulator